MTAINRILASRLAARLHSQGTGALAWDDLRDQVDLITGGELDCFQLDMLTDWVEEKRRTQGG